MKEDFKGFLKRKNTRNSMTDNTLLNKISKLFQLIISFIDRSEFLSYQLPMNIQENSQTISVRSKCSIILFMQDSDQLDIEKLKIDQLIVKAK